MISSKRIPSLDISEFKANGGGSLSSEFVEKIGRSFEDTGFIILKNHPVSSSLQSDVYAVIKKFFELPLEEKLSYEVKGIGGARGYTRFGTEHAKDYSVGDLKEFFHVGMALPPGHPLEKEYPPNISVSSLPNFDKTLRTLYEELLKLGMDVLKAIALYLELPEDFFDEKVRYGNSILRPIHYPPLKKGDTSGALRSAPHEDINLITLLIGASSPGLQVKNNDGEWIEVTTQPHEIVVNIGDMMQRLTNHRLKSTTHQVVNAPLALGALAESTRFSVPFFLHPVSSMSLEALPSCVNTDRPPKEEAILAGTYLQQRLQEIGLK